MAQLHMEGNEPNRAWCGCGMCTSEINTNQCLKFWQTAPSAPTLHTWPFELSPQEYTYRQQGRRTDSTADRQQGRQTDSRADRQTVGQTDRH